MCNCVHELLNVFEDSAQREHTINVFSHFSFYSDVSQSTGRGVNSKQVNMVMVQSNINQMVKGREGNQKKVLA